MSGDIYKHKSADTRRFFGRRKGKALSTERQRLIDQVLPRVRLPLSVDPCIPGSSKHNPDDIFRLFSPVQNISDVWLEIGFGGGEHLAWQAARYPDIGFIGAEPFINGVASLLRYIVRDDLHKVRVWDDDIRYVLSALPDGCLGRVFALFQDPWPKRRHKKRRLINTVFLETLARCMRPGAEFRWSTDDPVFLRWSLFHCLCHNQFVWTAQSEADWRHRPHDWPATRYEHKARQAGREIYYFSFVRL